MSLKHAVLGLINERPRHGYAVRALCEERMGDLVDLGHGRVYDVLASLEHAGLVCGTRERVGRRTRKVYSIRPAGRRELLDWAHREPSSSFGLQDLLLRLLAVGSDPRAAAAIVRMSERHARAVLTAIIACRDALEQRGRSPPWSEVLRGLERS